MKRLLLIAALTASVAAIVIPSASASTRVLPLSAQPNGWTYDQWHAIWARRSLQRDWRSLHSLVATRNGTCGQKVGQARAWMLPVSGDGALAATCRIRPGTRLALSAGGIFTIYGGPKNLNGTINRYWPDLLSVGLWVDGVSLTPHLMKTPFLHARVPYYNAQLFGVPKTLISFV